VTPDGSGEAGRRRSRRRRILLAGLALVGVPVAVGIGLHFLRTAADPAQVALTIPTLGSSVWPSGGRLFASNLLLAALATGMALVLAFPVGVYLGRRGRAVLVALAVSPLVIPPHLSAYIWRFTLEDAARGLGAGAVWASPQRSFAAAAWTLAAMYWPVVALPVAVAIRFCGRRVREELATLAPPRAVFWRAVAPGLLPALLGGAGIFFLLALSNYGVPLMWNVPSQVLAAFAQLEIWRDQPARAIPTSLPLILTAAALCGAGLLWLARRPYGFALTAGPRRDAGPARWSAALTVAVLTATVAVPLTSLATYPGVFRPTRAYWQPGREAFLCGIVFAGLGATGAVVLGAGLARATRRAPRVVRGLIEVIGLFSLFVPAILICLLLAAGRAGPAWVAAVYDSPAVFAVAYGLRFFYIPWRVTRSAQRLEGRAYHETERMLGLGPCRRALLALGGALGPAVACAWLIVFALALGELEIATFLAPAGWQPLSTFLDNQMHYARQAGAMQWVLIVVAAELAVVCLAGIAGRLQWRTLRATT